MKNNIASERTRLGMSQEDLADSLDVSRDSVKGWESGDKPIRSTLLIAMGDLFGCSIDYLMGRTEDRLVKRAS